ncbi:MAG: hypothetical protein RLZZ414_1507 [Bacteroidota bacterium]|jgi:hypothetical protein
MELKVIVYILIAIGYLIFNGYKKLKLPPENKGEPYQPETKRPIDPIEELIQELKGGKDLSKIDEEKLRDQERRRKVMEGESLEEINEEAELFTYESLEDERARFKQYEGYVVESSSFSSTENSGDTIKYDYNAESIARKKRKIDIKKALVSSVILNRKYI